MIRPSKLSASMALVVVLSAAGLACAADKVYSSNQVKPASRFTADAQSKLRQTLPFGDTADFDEAKKGFIAAPNYRKIEKDGGGIAWNMDNWNFLLEGKQFDTINPSLQRQATLNMAYGLFEVVPGIYQVRGFDLANITFIKGKTGWIIIDPLTAAETSRAALKFINEKLGARPVVAVIYSHSHGDHFAGVRGVVDDAALNAGKVQIIAPENFMYESISENMFAGNVMVRRKSYTYADLLPTSPSGHVDGSIGKATAHGTTGIIAPTREIKKAYEALTIDGVKMEFQLTPGTEAPAEMNTWFPDMKAFWAGENIVAGQHNIYTLRGAKVRDASAWAGYINESLYRYGDDAVVMFASHSWPRWGKARIQQVMRAQRDMYANLNNQILHLANEGVTINEIHNVYAPPASLQKEWFTRAYHGSYEHNARAVINRYLGYWDGNPTTLVPLSPGDSAPLYVEMMGGANKIMARGKALNDEGKYRLSMEILNKLVYAEPANQQAKNLLADAFEQLGYQAESPSLRNCYLSAAKELRDGIVGFDAVKKSSPDMLRGTNTELLLQNLAISVDSRKAEGLQFKINLVHPDINEKFVIEMSNATLTVIKGYQAVDAALSISVNRSDFVEVLLGKAKLVDLAKSGKAKVTGDMGVLKQLTSATGKYDTGFEIMPGTKRAKAAAPKGADDDEDPFQEAAKAANE